MARPKKTVKERIEAKRFSIETIEKLAIHGLTDTEIGDILGVDERTINRWKQDESFLSALKKGKLQADLEVEKALYKRAIGHEYTETHKEGERDEAGNIKVVFVKTVNKVIPPDTAAAFIWLKNRRGWRDTIEQKHQFPEGIEIIIGKSKAKNKHT